MNLLLGAVIATGQCRLWTAFPTHVHLLCIVCISTRVEHIRADTVYATPTVIGALYVFGNLPGAR